MSARAQLADAVRPFGPGGHLPAAAVPALDALADALGIPREAPPARAGGYRLGSLSERYESGGYGPGTVSSGRGDPGGASYGTYQLASKTGTVAAFVRNEGAAWPGLRAHSPGSVGFSTAWREIAARDPEGFNEAQRAFIERTHYRPTVDAVKGATGVDLDAHPDAVREAVWSMAVQHGGAANLIERALADPSASTPVGLLRALYAVRSSYVARLADHAPSPATRRVLQNVVDSRYPDELERALAMLGENP